MTSIILRNKTHILLILTLMIIEAGNCQSTSVDSNIVSTSRHKLKDQELAKYANSINIYKAGKAIPIVFMRTCIDYEGYYWSDMHTPISVRRAILSKVTNVEAIK